MKKIFIDTNIFLDFYRANTDKIRILEDLKKYSKNIVFPVLVFNEYRRNRLNQLNHLLNNCLEMAKIKRFSSSIIRGFKEYNELDAALIKYSEIIKRIIEKIKGMQYNEENDMVYMMIKELYDVEGIEKIQFSEGIIDKAKRRQLLGTPPISNKFSICDEIIWETILAGAKYDLVIVSRDSTYTINESLLKEEYQRVTGSYLIKITDKISDAIKLIDEEMPQDIIELENDQLKEIKSIIPPIIIDDINDYYGKTFSKTPEERYCYACGRVGLFTGIMCLNCGQRDCD